MSNEKLKKNDEHIINGEQFLHKRIFPLFDDYRFVEIV